MFLISIAALLFYIASTASSPASRYRITEEIATSTSNYLDVTADSSSILISTFNDKIIHLGYNGTLIRQWIKCSGTYCRRHVKLQGTYFYLSTSSGILEYDPRSGQSRQITSICGCIDVTADFVFVDNAQISKSNGSLLATYSVQGSLSAIAAIGRRVIFGYDCCGTVAFNFMNATPIYLSEWGTPFGIVGDNDMIAVSNWHSYTIDYYDQQSLVFRTSVSIPRVERPVRLQLSGALLFQGYSDPAFGPLNIWNSSRTLVQSLSTDVRAFYAVSQSTFLTCHGDSKIRVWKTIYVANVSPLLVKPWQQSRAEIVISENFTMSEAVEVTVNRRNCTQLAYDGSGIFYQ